MCVVVAATTGSWWCRRVLRWVTRDKTGLLDEEELTLALRMLNVTNVKEVLLPPPAACNETTAPAPNRCPLHACHLETMNLFCSRVSSTRLSTCAATDKERSRTTTSSSCCGRCGRALFRHWHYPDTPPLQDETIGMMEFVQKDLSQKSKKKMMTSDRCCPP